MKKVLFAGAVVALMLVGSVQARPAEQDWEAARFIQDAWEEALAWVGALVQAGNEGGNGAPAAAAGNGGPDPEDPDELGPGIEPIG